MGGWLVLFFQPLFSLKKKKKIPWHVFIYFLIKVK